MQGIKDRDTTYAALRLVLIIWLAALVPLMSVGEMVFAHSDDACEDECDDSCQECGTCTNCSRTVPMLSTPFFQMNSPLRADAGSISVHALENESSLAAGIDHPPQNIL